MAVAAQLVVTAEGQQEFGMIMQGKKPGAARVGKIPPKVGMGAAGQAAARPAGSSGSGKAPIGSGNGKKPPSQSPGPIGGQGTAHNKGGYAAQKEGVKPKPGGSAPVAAVGGTPLTEAAATQAAASAANTAQVLYAGLAARDGAAMAGCYDQDVDFYDPLFKNLQGANEVMEMWNTILPAANPATFKITHEVGQAAVNRLNGSATVKVHWHGSYDLGSRHVENDAQSTLVIKDGKIISQRDTWDLSAWMKQALPVGGGNPMVQDVVSHAAHTFIEIKAFLDGLT